MTVSALEMAMLRAQIAGQDEEARSAFGQQAATSDDMSGLAVLVYAAFVIAARREFAAGWSRGGVIRYAGRVRALLSERPGLLNPRVAEDELFGALGGEHPVGHEAGAVAAARLFLLDALIASLVPGYPIRRTHWFSHTRSRRACSGLARSEGAADVFSRGFKRPVKGKLAVFRKDPGKRSVSVGG